MDPRSDSIDRGFARVANVFLLVAVFLMSAPGLAQDFVTPGPNTNVVGLTPNLAYIPDFQLKQQQEPSCIMSPANQLYIFCAYNDLRASDLPLVQGDSWMGVSMSNDGGDTWFSRLAPGFLGHLNSLGQGFAADPAVVAIPGNSPGLAILNYIAANRGSNDGLLVAQRWVEYPQEDQDFWKPEDNIVVIADGSEGRFIDKPAFLYIIDPVSGQGSITQQINVEGEVQPISVTTPTGTLIAVYAVFTGNGGSKVLKRQSTDNGLTWSNSEKISEEQNEVTGVSVTAIGQDFVIVYRRKGDNNQPDAIMSASCSLSGNQNCSKGEVMFQLCPFDQPASGSTHRTFSFPWAANDGKRFWAFAADRRFANDASCTPVPGAPGLYSGKPRIVGMSSVNGKDWVGASGTETMPFVVAPRDEGFQVMPVAFGTKGRIDIAWYDTFREEDIGLPAGPNDILINDYASGTAKVARKADVWMTRLTANCPNNANAGCTPTIENPVRVSQYPTALETSQANLKQEVKAHLPNWTLYASGTLAFNGDYISLATPPFRKIANGKFIQNSRPQGDAGAELPGYVNQQNLYVAWGDNRDVEADISIVNVLSQLPYTPPVNSDANPGGPAVRVDEVGNPENVADLGEFVAATEPDDDPGLPNDLYQCVIDFDYTHSRDSNIYGSLVQDAPTLVSPSPTKPLGTIQRMFPLEITNVDPLIPQNYCLHIENQPPDFAAGLGLASFYQLPSVAPFADGDQLELLDVLIPGGSSVSRSVFVTTSDGSTVIDVSAYEGACPATTAGPFGPLINTVQLSDGALFDPVYCETNVCDPVANGETHDITLVGSVLQAPVLEAPSFEAPSFEAPVLEAPVLEAPSFEAPSFEAPSFEAPVLEAPSFEAPSFEAPVLEAPSLEAPSLEAGTPMGDADPDELVVQDITYVVGMESNVTTTVSADIAINGLDPDTSIVQLIAWTPNIYTTTSACLAVPQANQQIIAYTELDAPSLEAVTLPYTISPDDQDPYVGALSFTGRPNQNIALTVRIWASGTEPGTAGHTLAMLDAELRACLADPDCNPVAENLGAQQLIAFGASAHGCTTSDAIINTQNANQPDCLDNAAEKIYQDKFGPIISVPADFSQEATGPSGAVVSYSASVTDDADPSPMLTCTPASGSIFGLGENTVSCWAEDLSGNISDASFTVTVVDTTDPVLPALANQVEEATGPSGATVSWATPIATDIVDPSPIVSCAPASGSVFALGTTPVSCTATDASGNSASSSFDVTVQDTTAPVIPAVANVSAEATSATGAIVSWSPIAATDAYDVSVPAVCTPASGSLFPIGMMPVSCVATDSNGNASAPAGFVVTVSDSTAPVISLPSLVTVLARDATDSDADFAVDATTATVTVEANLPPPDGARISYAPPAIDAVDGDPEVVCVPASGSTFPVDTTEVSCTATDGINESAPLLFSITVQDTTDPVFSVADGTVYSFEADMPGGAWVDLVGDEDLHATDRGARLEPTCVAVAADSSEYTLPALLAPGDYDVTCSIDGVSTVLTLSVIVDVNDEVPPVLNIPASVLEVSADPLTGAAVVNFLAAGAFPGGESITATDIVDTDVDVACVPASGSTFYFGDTEVTCTASDDGPNSAGLPNSTTASFTLRVLDVTPPTPPALPAPSGSNITKEATGASGAIVTWDTVVTSDAIDPDPAIVCSPPSGSTFPIGTTAVVCTSTDFSGNSSTGGFNVTVQDTTAPVFDPLMDVTAEATSPAGATVSWTPIYAEDIVDGSVLAVCSPASGSQFALGTTAVACTATDNAGQSNTVGFDVIVQDTTAPSISASDIDREATTAVVDITLDYITGNVLISDIADPSPSLACYIQNPDEPTDTSDNANPRQFTAYGSSVAICSATDASGNSASTSFYVNINFPYDIELILPKGKAQAGSTIPIDWIYKSKTDGTPIDSAFLDPMIRWIGPYASNDNTCSGFTDGSGSGEDSGSSDRRYSASQLTWQFSWQTPGIAGHYLLLVSPPGSVDPNATACVDMK